MNRIVLASMAALIGASAFAAPVTYTLDPAHTYPSFEADHFGGLSVWRGKFESTSGKVVYDKEAKSGSIEVSVDMNTIDFGMQKLNDHAKSVEIFDTAKYPTATYSGKFTKFNGDAPTEAQGTLTMHGVTKPVTLDDQFLQVHSPPAEQEASLRRGRIGHDQSRRFRCQLRRETRLQAGSETADPSRGQPRSLRAQEIGPPPAAAGRLVRRNLVFGGGKFSVGGSPRCRCRWATTPYRTPTDGCDVGSARHQRAPIRDESCCPQRRNAPGASFG